MLSDGKRESQNNVRFSYRSLIGCFGSKIDQKTHPENQNKVHGPAGSFLAGETVGFCLNAPAGPARRHAGFDHRSFTSMIYAYFLILID